MADSNQIRTWKESVKGIITYYLERAPGAEIEERRYSLIFYYKSAEDYDTAARLASDCVSHINDACETQRVHAVPFDGCVIVEPVDWTKSTAAERVFDDIRRQIPGDEAAQRSPADFLMVVGDGREDEKGFRWANQLADDKALPEVITVSLAQHAAGWPCLFGTNNQSAGVEKGGSICGESKTWILRRALGT